MRGMIHVNQSVEFETIDVPWGTMHLICETEDFGSSVTSIRPGRCLPPYYYKTGGEFLYILKGQGECPQGQVSKGDMIQVRPGETFWLRNTSPDQPLRTVVICVPPYSPDDCVWLNEDSN